MTDLVRQRQFFAEEIRICGDIRTAALVDAFAMISREAFLPPGPWTIRGDGDPFAAPRLTPDADPRHVHHNVSVAIDIDRQLFNGAPAVVASALDALELTAGSRVLHIGCGLGYYTAIIANVVGSAGQVAAIEVDRELAQKASDNLRAFSWVAVQEGNGSEPLSQPFDAILVHAGVTHPLDTWLDALTMGGRLVVPITAAMPQMGRIGKGFFFVVTRCGDDTFDAWPLGLTAIYTAVGIRDDSLDSLIGAAMMKAWFPRVARLRRDRHEPGPACWLHGSTYCLQG
jgi:protein-L-isoaspartate(D-aspartate) O-methyltransferase